MTFLSYRRSSSHSTVAMVATFLAFLTLTVSADAQYPIQYQYGTQYIGTVPTGSKPTYKWTDNRGVIVYSDSLPPESCSTASCIQIRERERTERQVAAPSSSPSTYSKGQARRDSQRDVMVRELEKEQAQLAKAEQELSKQEAIRTGDEKNYSAVLERLRPYRDKVQLHRNNVSALRYELGLESKPRGWQDVAQVNSSGGRGIVMSCSEAKALLTTVASLKDQGYPLSRALEIVNQSSDFSASERTELRQIISAIYQHNLSPAAAFSAASLSCR